MWHSLPNQQLSYKNNWHMLAQWENHARSVENRICLLQVIHTNTVDQSQGFAVYRWVLALFADLLWLLLFEEAFIKVMKLSVSILEADSMHFCHLQRCFSIDRIRSINAVDTNKYQWHLMSLTFLDHIFSVFPSWLKGFEYSVTLLDKINSLLHVALHSVTVTNCSNDQFMNPLLLL